MLYKITDRDEEVRGGEPLCEPHSQRTLRGEAAQLEITSVISGSPPPRPHKFQSTHLPLPKLKSKLPCQDVIKV